MKKLLSPLLAVTLLILSSVGVNALASDPVAAFVAAGEAAVLETVPLAMQATDLSDTSGPGDLVAPDPSQGVALAASLGFAADSLLAKLLYWGCFIIGAATAFLRLAVLVTRVTPSTKDDLYISKASRYLSMLLAFIDKFVAWGLPADKARRQ